MEHQNTPSRNLQLQIPRTPRTPHFPLSPPVSRHSDQSSWSFRSSLPRSSPRLPAPRSGYVTPIHFHREDIPSSPIATSEGANAVLLGACKAIETAVEKGLEGGPVHQSFEIDDNKAFLQENLESEDENESDEEDWLDEDLDDTNSNFFYIFMLPLGMECLQTFQFIFKSYIRIIYQARQQGCIRTRLFTSLFGCHNSLFLAPDQLCFPMVFAAWILLGFVFWLRRHSDWISSTLALRICFSILEWVFNGIEIIPRKSQSNPY